MKKNYNAIADLQHIYLEDSFVLAIAFDGASLVFHLDAVLTESHSGYTSPKTGEQYCYHGCKLRFSDLKDVDWRRVFIRGNLDAANELDFGNINSFFFDNDTFYLAGEWGEVIVRCESFSCQLCAI